MHSWEKRVALLIVSFLFLMAAFYSQQVRLDLKMDEARRWDYRLAETTYLPPNEVLQVLSLGYKAFLADMIFMQANNHFATHLSFDRKYVWLDNYVGAIIGYCRNSKGVRVPIPPELCDGSDGTEWVDGLFPFNPRVYLWASQVVKYAQLITDDIVDKSIYFGKTGIHYCPDSWELYYDVGFNLFFEYRGLDEETKQLKKKEALDYFSLATTLPNSRVGTHFATGTMWTRGSKEQALKQFYSTYYHSSEQDRSEMRNLARTYGHSRLADTLEAEEKSWKEDFPYISIHLYQLLGPRLDSKAGFQKE